MSLSHPHRRWRAAGVHLLISAAVAALVAGAVFGVLYPPPFDALTGGLALFMLLVGVDVVMGPALTLVAAAPAKPRHELRRDLAIIALLQLAALAYGLHTMWQARPVYLVFEVDRLRAVTAADIDPDLLSEAAPDWRTLPLARPRLIAAVKPRDPSEQLRAIDLGLAGIDLGMVPSYWRPFDALRDQAWATARPVPALLARYPDLAGRVAAIARQSGTAVDALRFLPAISRHASGVIVVADDRFEPLHYLPVDGFF